MQVINPLMKKRFYICLVADGWRQHPETKFYKEVVDVYLLISRQMPAVERDAKNTGAFLFTYASHVFNWKQYTLVCPRNIARF